MKQSTYKTRTYELGKGWMLDIIEYEDQREAWIYRIEMGIKSMMFGRNKKDDTYKKFLDMAINQFPTYTDDYMYDFG